MIYINICIYTYIAHKRGKWNNKNYNNNSDSSTSTNSNHDHNHHNQHQNQLLLNTSSVTLYNRYYHCHFIKEETTEQKA